MARKLSGIARQGSIRLALVLTLAAGSTARAEEELRVSSPPNVVENPFATKGETQPAVVADEPETPRATTTTYRNPFATPRSAPMKLAPPVALPARPGPISRWQSSNQLADDATAVRSAILDAAKLTAEPSNVDGLIPSDSPGLASFGQPPDPIQFAPRSLAQPAWLTGDIDLARPLTPSAAQAEPISIDTFSLPERAIPSIRGFSEGSDSSLPGGFGSATVFITDESTVADHSGSLEVVYEEAREVAAAAESVDQLSAAIDLCQRGLGGEPSMELTQALRRLAAWSYNRRGELRADAREGHEAFADFQAAIALDPACWSAVHNRGVMLAERGQASAALRDFNRVLELNPTLPLAYRNRAELLASLGRMTEAVSDYSRAIEQSPKDADVYRARGSAWHRLGDFDRALADFDKAIDLSPEDADAYTQRGNVSAEQGQFKSAMESYRQALAIDSDWGEAHRSLAWLCATCPDPRYRDSQQSLAAANDALALAPPNDSFTLDAAAAAHANAGQFEKAVELQHQAVSSAPPDLAEQMRQRLSLYQQGQPFRSRPAGTRIVEPASHQFPAAEARSERPNRSSLR